MKPINQVLRLKAEGNSIKLAHNSFTRFIYPEIGNRAVLFLKAFSLQSINLNYHIPAI
jgi:hypothetical protein